MKENILLLLYYSVFISITKHTIRIAAYIRGAIMRNNSVVIIWDLSPGHESERSERLPLLAGSKDAVFGRSPRQELSESSGAS